MIQPVDVGVPRRELKSTRSRARQEDNQGRLGVYPTRYRCQHTQEKHMLSLTHTSLSLSLSLARAPQAPTTSGQKAIWVQHTR